MKHCKALYFRTENLFAIMLFVMISGIFSQVVAEPGEHSIRSLNTIKRGTSSMRRALLVGINQYSPDYGVSELNAAVADAEGVRDIMLLSDPSNRWMSVNIQLLTDAQATKADIRGALATLAATSSAGDMVLYYHSGHGGQYASTSDASKTFLCAYDASYTDVELAADLALFHPSVKIIIIVDACHSGGMFKNQYGVREWPFARRVAAEYRSIRANGLLSKGLEIPKTLGDNIAFMTSSHYTEYSWELDAHGVYTGYLLNGCGRPAVDTNNDGEYQFMELHLYAAEKAAALTEGTGYQQNAQSYNDKLLRNTVARTVGSRLLRAAGMNNDYSGDGKSDVVVYNEETGLWYIVSLGQGIIAWGVPWGGPGFFPLIGDYNGDGSADLAVYHEATGKWYIRSLANELITWDFSWGGIGLTPIAGDYSGNGSTDLALYDKSSGYWYVITLGGQPVVVGESLTGAGFTAVPGDYNGNNVAEFVTYHDGMGRWYATSSTGSPVITGAHWGGTGYTPVPGDYDGNGFFDLAVYCNYTGNWYIWSHINNSIIAWNVAWGGGDYIPVPGDYNGDGIWDLAVYSPSTGEWLIKSLLGSEVIASGIFGGPGFMPVRGTP